jgi:threonine synthase
MLYVSTRGYAQKSSASQVIKAGIAPDGGLYVPEAIPLFSKEEILSLYDKNYSEIASAVLKKFLTDFSDEELKTCIDNAYDFASFDTPTICPLRLINDNLFALELWHGPTSAFKDMALQLLPHLMSVSIKKANDQNTTVILVATSGDTGKAALEGFKDVDGTKIIVFYPENGVSPMQKLQMKTQEGKNVYVVGIDGNFDDAQRGVKDIFNNKDLNKKYLSDKIMLSSANSINWGRLVPQIIYYFSSYINLLKSSHIKYGDKINICVPTGNFGNIMAAYYAKRMGLPINKLIIAANRNNVLSKFLNTGIYNASRKLSPTISPSMDILVSSNLERLLFETCNHNSHKISEIMNQLYKNGQYQIDNNWLKEIKQDFYADYATETETKKTIKDIYKKYNYVIDPHTAVGFSVYNKYLLQTEDSHKTIIASTANSYKFSKSVVTSILGAHSTEDKSEFELMNLLSCTTNTLVPTRLKFLNQKPILHKTTCQKNEMQDMVTKILSK